MMRTFAGIQRQELEEARDMITGALVNGVSSFDEYNRKVGELKGIRRALLVLDETVAAYEQNESRE